MFLNTIAHSLDLMKQGGIDAGMQRQETDDALILTINIPKARAARAGRAAGRTRAGRKKIARGLDSGAAASYTLIYIYVERPPVRAEKEVTA